MQGIWRKVGAAIGSAVILGATFGAAAFAQTAMDLGDYKSLVVSSDGTVSGLFVVGADAATADVVSAIDAAGWVTNQQVAGEGAAGGQVVLTPIETTVTGVKRHIQIDDNASNAYELGTAHTAGGVQDKIGPAGYASGDGVVDFLYSYKNKGPLYYSGADYQWHEELNVTLGNLNASRDDLESQAQDLYDEVVMKISANSLKYNLKFDKAFANANLNTILRGQKIWFMGKEYTVISAETTKIKLGATDAEVLLTTSNPKTTVGGVDVTLGGIFAVGTSGTYKAKITVTSGGTTETKFVTSGDTDTVAGIEIYVKNAVVTTSGTNEGEAQLVVGAGIIKLTDGDYLKRGDGTETTWLTTITNGSVGETSLTITASESQAYTALGGTYNALRPGGVIKAPNDLFTVTYNGLTNDKGTALKTRTINVNPELRIVKGVTTADTVRIKSVDGDFLYYNGSYVTSDMWVNTSTATFFVRDTTTEPVSWKESNTTPTIKVATGKDYTLNWTRTAVDSANGYLSIGGPALSQTGAGAPDSFVIVYNAATDKFDTANASSYYAYNQQFFTGDATARADAWFGRTSNLTPATRDYYTVYGAYVSSVSPQLITIKFPEGQAYAELVVGSQATGKGKAITVTPGQTATIGGTVVNVTGAVSGGKGVSLPAALAKLDTEVTSGDKSGYTLVLVGGPKVNRLVNELQTTNKLTKTIGPGAAVSAKGAGVIELVSDAWGTGKYAVVVAGADRVGTAKASKVLASFDANKALLDGKTVYEV